jgi:hypothetical protein
MLVPTTQEVWFIKGHYRYLGAIEIIPWPIGPLYNAMPSIETLDNGDDIQKKKRIQKYKHRLTPNQKLRKQEADQIKNSTTLLKRSTRCTLPNVVDKEEAKQYYKS